MDHLTAPLTRGFIIDGYQGMWLNRRTTRMQIFSTQGRLNLGFAVLNLN